MMSDIEVSCVAEGIEDEKQLEILKGACCDAIQGYIFSKPLTIREFELWQDVFKANR